MRSRSARTSGSGSQIAGTKSRRASSARTLASMRSVSQASGARPLIFCASAISTFDELGPHSFAEQERRRAAPRTSKWQVVYVQDPDWEAEYTSLALKANQWGPTAVHN